MVVGFRSEVNSYSLEGFQMLLAFYVPGKFISLLPLEHR